MATSPAKSLCPYNFECEPAEVVVELASIGMLGGETEISVLYALKTAGTCIPETTKTSRQCAAMCLVKSTRGKYCFLAGMTR